MTKNDAVTLALHYYLTLPFCFLLVKASFSVDPAMGFLSLVGIVTVAVAIKKKKKKGKDVKNV